MAAIAETTGAAELHDVQHQRSDMPAAEHATDSFGGALNRVFSPTPGDPSADTARFLSHPTLAQRANGPFRSSAFKRAQQTYGNHFAQNVVRGIQRQPDGSGIVQRNCACGGTCEKCQNAGTSSTSSPYSPSDASPRIIQNKATNGKKRAGPEDHKEIIPLASRGEPLDERTRDVMESGLATDFGDVRIHTDSAAAGSAKALGANAYTTGRDIYFAAGKYAPENAEGKRLLAHELVHTTQQSTAPSFSRHGSSTGNLIIDPDDALEQDADRTADRIVSAAPIGAVQRAKTSSQRLEHTSETQRSFGPAPIQRQAIPGAMGTLVAAPGGKDFNPGSIVNDLRRAIDQSEATFAGYEEDTSSSVFQIRKMKFHRKVDFETVYKVLNDLSADQIKIVRDLYAEKEGKRAEKEGKRSLDNDLFETGESGYPSNLTHNQRARLRVLLRGTAGDAVGPQVSEYLKRFKSEVATRLQRLLTQSNIPPARLNQIESAALEIAHILSDDLDGPKRERLMALHRRPVEEIDILDAFYQAHTGVNLPVELSGKLEGLQLSRMYQLRSGNIPLADSFAIEDKRRAIEQFDRIREEFPIQEGALNLVVSGTSKKLDMQRQKLVDEIDQIIALNRQEAMAAAAAEGTMTTAAEAVAERLKAVLGQGRDEVGRNVGDMLKITLGQKKAAELTSITSGALIKAHALRLAETESRKETTPAQIIAIIQQLRAEAEHDFAADFAARVADPWMSLEAKKDLLGKKDEKVQSRASANVAQFQYDYENVRGEGRPWAEIVEGFKSVDEDEVKRMTSGAGVMTDAQQLDLAIRRDKPDLALNVLKRQPTQEAIFDLKMKYFALTGKWLEESIYGYRWQRVATAEEAASPARKYFGISGGIASGRDAALMVEQLEKPAEKDRGGEVEMQWVAASAEWEYEVTWANRGTVGWLREAGDDPETETIMRETRDKVRSLRKKWLDSKDQPEQRRILAEMKLWRATLTGDAAAYEADNKKMVDQIRSVVSLAVQLALAIALPGAGTTFMGLVRATAMQIATSVASNVVIYGEDYSLAQLRGDIVGGLLGAAGGKLGEELVGGAIAAKAALGAKEARAVAGEIADVIAKPVADATAKGAAKVGIRTTIAKEAANQVGSAAGLTLASGENKFTLKDFFEGALMSGAAVVGKKMFRFDGPKPATETRAPAGEGTRQEQTAVTHPTEPETSVVRTGDEPVPAKHGEEGRVATPDVPREPKPTKTPTSDAELEASVEQSSHLETVTEQQAVNEVVYINKHPEQFHVDGDAPNRRIPLKHGEHEIAETPGGCVRHSPGAQTLSSCPIFKAVEEAEKSEPARRDIPALDRLGESRLRREVIDRVNDLGGDQRVRAEAQARRESAQEALDNFRQRAAMRTGGDRTSVPDATQDHIRDTLVEIVLDPVFGQLTLNELNAQIKQQFPAVRKRGAAPSLLDEANRLREIVDAANRRRIEQNNAQNAAELAIQGQRAMTGISVGTGVVGGGTLEVTRVPGAAPERLGRPMVGASPGARTAAPTDQPQRYWHRLADGSLNPEPQWADHAERQVLASAAAQLEAQFPGVPRASITGELKIHVEQVPCSNCVAGLGADHTSSGPLHQFSQEFPGVRIIVTFDGAPSVHVPNSPLIVQNGQSQ